MNQEETTQTTYDRVSQEGLDDIPGYLTNDMFSERIDLKVFLGNFSSYSIPINAKVRFTNNITSYLKFYTMVFLIILMPSIFLSFKFFIVESLLNSLLFFFGNKLSKKLSKSPFLFVGIYILLHFILCFMFNRIIIWFLVLISIGICCLHALTRIHAEEVFFGSV